MEIRINPEFQSLIPPLSVEEYQQLEENILQEDLREPIVVWNDFIVDGHNRYKICLEHKIPFKTTYGPFEPYATKEDIKIWIIQNQFGRRNLSAFSRAELALKLKGIITSKAKENQGKRTDISQNSVECIDTQKSLAKQAQTSHDTIHKVEKILEKATPEVIAQVRSGEESIHKAFCDIRREEKRAEVIKNLEDIGSKGAKALEGVYDVIVIDPPWPMEKIERDVSPTEVGFDYPTMTIESIQGLNIPCAEDCHLWLWTTHKHFPTALKLLEGWGLKYVCIFVWHKDGAFQPFGLPQYNCEFAIYARKGTPTFIDLKSFKLCFSAPRTGHSQKPEEFYELIRRVTGGRRLDMFNRRKIDGFDGWGNEA